MSSTSRGLWTLTGAVCLALSVGVAARGAAQRRASRPAAPAASEELRDAVASPALPAVAFAPRLGWIAAPGAPAARPSSRPSSRRPRG